MAAWSKRARRRFYRIALVVAVVLVVLLLRLVEEIGPEKRPEDRFAVVAVIDGDTMELLGGDKVRLLGIDTPEEGEPFFEEATALLKKLSLDKTAAIEYGRQRRDRYGRILGYVYMDSLFVNQAIIDSGFAYVYLFEDNELNSEPVRRLVEAQRSAIQRRTGLWSLPYAPEEKYIHTEGSFRLHRPGCRSLKNLRPGHYEEFKTREEGMALGYSPCRNCRP